MGPVDTWLWALAGAAVLAVAWAVCWSIPALLLRRNDIADIAWGLMFPFVALLVGGAVTALDPGELPRSTIVLTLVVAWGLRLAWHIGRRWAVHEQEDRRYAAMREGWGGRRVALRSVVQVFLLQAVIALVVVQPVLLAVAVHRGDVQLGLLDLLGGMLVVAGIVLEATADRQLARFLARRKAGGEERRYLTNGVWSWSRHPNYAGDAIVWMGFGAFGVAAALDAAAPWLVIPALVGPAVMWGFLRYGSGVPIAERGRSGHPEWDAYVERTSAFWPRPPRSS